jgi:hypothetical protein
MQRCQGRIFVYRILSDRYIPQQCRFKAHENVNHTFLCKFHKKRLETGNKWFGVHSADPIPTLVLTPDMADNHMGVDPYYELP